MNLYKGHIVAEDAWCDECGILVGDDVLLNYDETLHECSGVHVITTAKAPAEFREIAAPAPAESMDANKAQAAMAALQDLFGAPKAIDHAEVERIAREVINGVVYPTKTVVVRDGETKTIEGTTHGKLATVVAVAQTDHVMMVGPAGTGKSTIAEQAAEALGLTCYSISLSPQTPASQLLGYMDANGKYVRTPFREAFENGQAFHFDEVDKGHPGILAVVNSALANGHMTFPDGNVKRGDGFVAFASANTYGLGPNAQYVGSNKLDAAFLDRFGKVFIGYDEPLESAICHGTGASQATVDKVLTYVRKLRKSAIDNGLPVILSPRASKGMCNALQSDLSWDESVDIWVRGGIGDDVWAKLTR
ncbi:MULTISPECIES: AAA family ATPase [Mycobacteroides]|uniref:AAA family ATPase n=1 Tax=Mycobacteroides TaxID=670516 RepID=UPI000941401B|nr:AAA family ATPase [Mycobacteroides abscessus]